jgi:hypothetical protein
MFEPDLVRNDNHRNNPPVNPGDLVYLWVASDWGPDLKCRVIAVNGAMLEVKVDVVFAHGTTSEITSEEGSRFKGQIISTNVAYVHRVCKRR